MARRAMETWDEEQVADYIRGISDEEVWQNLAADFKRDGLGGKELMHLTENDLIQDYEVDQFTAARAVTKIQTVLWSEGRNFCLDHKTSEIREICGQCHVPVCDFCIAEEHQGHPLIRQEQYDRTNIDKILRDAQEETARLEMIRQELQTQEKAIQSNKDTLSKQIFQYAKKITDAVQKNFDDSKRMLDVGAEDLRSQLEILEKQVLPVITLLEQLISAAQQEDDQASLVIGVLQLQAKVQELEKATLAPLPAVDDELQFLPDEELVESIKNAGSIDARPPPAEVRHENRSGARSPQEERAPPEGRAQDARPVETRSTQGARSPQGERAPFEEEDRSSRSPPPKLEHIPSGSPAGLDSPRSPVKAKGKATKSKDMTEWIPCKSKLKSPWGVAVNGKYVVVADTDNDRIVVFDRASGDERILGSKGKGEKQLSRPIAVALGEGVLFIADNGNRRVLIWTLDGEYRGTFKGSFSNPKSICLSGNYVYVTDEVVGTSVIHICSLLGELIRKLEFDEPGIFSLAVGQEALYFSDKSGLKQCSKDGTNVVAFAGNAGFRQGFKAIGLAIQHDRLCATDFDRFVMLDLQGQVIVSSNEIGLPALAMPCSCGIWENSVFVVDRGNHRVVECELSF